MPLVTWLRWRRDTEVLFVVWILLNVHFSGTMTSTELPATATEYPMSDVITTETYDMSAMISDETAYEDTTTTTTMTPELSATATYDQGPSTDVTTNSVSGSTSENLEYINIAAIAGGVGGGVGGLLIILIILAAVVISVLLKKKRESVTVDPPVNDTHPGIVVESFYDEINEENIERDARTKLNSYTPITINAGGIRPVSIYPSETQMADYYNSEERGEETVIDNNYYVAVISKQGEYFQ